MLKPLSFIFSLITLSNKGWVIYSPLFLYYRDCFLIRIRSGEGTMWTCYRNRTITHIGSHSYKSQTTRNTINPTTPSTTRSRPQTHLAGTKSKPRGIHNQESHTAFSPSYGTNTSRRKWVNVVSTAWIANSTLTSSIHYITVCYTTTHWPFLVVTFNCSYKSARLPRHGYQQKSHSFYSPDLENTQPKLLDTIRITIRSRGNILYFLPTKPLNNNITFSHN